jgi:hypothetical protein
MPVYLKADDIPRMTVIRKVDSESSSFNQQCRWLTLHTLCDSCSAERTTKPLPASQLIAPGHGVMSLWLPHSLVSYTTGSCDLRAESGRCALTARPTLKSYYTAAVLCNNFISSIANCGNKSLPDLFSSELSIAGRRSCPMSQWLAQRHQTLSGNAANLREFINTQLKLG